MPAEFSLQKHLREEHHASAFQVYLKEIVYGGTDGIITTFAVVAGFTGAQAGSSMPTLPALTVLLFGLANLLADGASMGLSSFLSLRSEQDIYKAQMAKEKHEIKNKTLFEKEETISILKERGFTEEDALALTQIYMKNPDYWLSFMMNDELKLPNPLEEKPHYTSLVTFLAFVTFGFIPLIPYVLNPSPNAFLGSLFAAFVALLALGLLRFKVTGENILRCVLEILLVGAIAASIAYFVGTFFKI